ncbi:unnamed protein product [Linum tenue]|uniref:Uncharacterized protein n=1 Tax=Linum tenue TaxID=586396 RepID=A0AAV0PUC4_9ROSI|nr:unnamed protein product [Linum tenue]
MYHNKWIKFPNERLTCLESPRHKSPGFEISLQKI